MDGLAVGVCGTDREIAAGEYGWAPPGSDFSPGDLAVGVVRRPEWLGRLISRRVPLERFEDAFTPGADDVKVVITLHG